MHTACFKYLRGHYFGCALRTPSGRVEVLQYPIKWWTGKVMPYIRDFGLQILQRV
jgi:hypothetical protein